jgi:hypothetical protein
MIVKRVTPWYIGPVRLCCYWELGKESRSVEIGMVLILVTPSE